MTSRGGNYHVCFRVISRARQHYRHYGGVPEISGLIRCTTCKRAGGGCCSCPVIISSSDVKWNYPIRVLFINRGIKRLNKVCVVMWTSGSPSVAVAIKLSLYWEMMNMHILIPQSNDG